MDKKGDANIWWIIIGAVIALVVLVVLMLIFTGKTGGLERGLSECEGKTGLCVAGNACPGQTLKNTVFSCAGGNTCCLGTPRECTATGDCRTPCIADANGKSWCA